MSQFTEPITTITEYFRLPIVIIILQGIILLVSREAQYYYYSSSPELPALLRYQYYYQLHESVIKSTIVGFYPRALRYQLLPVQQRRCLLQGSPVRFRQNGIMVACQRPQLLDRQITCCSTPQRARFLAITVNAVGLPSGHSVTGSRMFVYSFL